jgi:hypothetical protein
MVVPLKKSMSSVMFFFFYSLNFFFNFHYQFLFNLIIVNRVILNLSLKIIFISFLFGSWGVETLSSYLILTKKKYYLKNIKNT